MSNAKFAIRTTTKVANWVIEELDTGAVFIMPDFATHRRSQFVSLHSDGTIAFDFPEDVPEYLKIALRRMAAARAKESHATTEAE